MSPLLLLALALTAPPPAPVPVAHRGLFHHAPENTLPAFAACRELRLGIEVDVRRTKDGKLVCVHDDTLTRTTGSKARVADATWDEIRKLDAGHWFDPVFEGEGVPSLDEVLDAEKMNPFIALDLKVDDGAIAGEIAKLVAKYGARDHVVCIGLAITGADLRKRLKAADPKLPVAVLAQTEADLAAAIADKHSDWVYVRFIPSAKNVADVHAARKKVFAVGPLFAGNEPENWCRAATAGADAILTDHPLELRRAVRAKP